MTRQELGNRIEGVGLTICVFSFLTTFPACYVAVGTEGLPKGTDSGELALAAFGLLAITGGIVGMIGNLIAGEHPISLPANADMSDTNMSRARRDNIS